MKVWFFIVQYGSIILGIAAFTFKSKEENLSTNYFQNCYFYCDQSTLNMVDPSGGIALCNEASLNLCINGTSLNTTVTGWNFNNLKENLWWNFTDTNTGGNVVFYKCIIPFILNKLFTTLILF